MISIEEGCIVAAYFPLTAEAFSLYHHHTVYRSGISLKGVGYGR